MINDKWSNIRPDDMKKKITSFPVGVFMMQPKDKEQESFYLIYFLQLKGQLVGEV